MEETKGSAEVGGGVTRGGVGLKEEEEVVFGAGVVDKGVSVGARGGAVEDVRRGY